MYRPPPEDIKSPNLWTSMLHNMLMEKCDYNHGKEKKFEQFNLSQGAQIVGNVLGPIDLYGMRPKEKGDPPIVSNLGAKEVDEKDRRDAFP